MIAPALEVRGLQKQFGALTVASDISLTLPRGARHALIGPNGAGKTTFVNLITGVLRPSAGQILLGGDDITALSQAARTRRGIARTFQVNRLFRGLTVLENVYLAIAERGRICRRLWRPAGAERAVIDEAFDHLQSLALVGDAGRLVRELPYGRQRLVEIAIALAQKPKLLLLDEPAAGVPSSENHLILDVISRLDPEISVLIIEHDMDVVFRFANRITVLVAGAVLTEGSPQEIVADERVRAVYLGESHGGAFPGERGAGGAS
jgi:ABC-type branched-subunit amino acid transport system ATPase component